MKVDKCFADNGRGRCLALDAKNCKDCVFFKTEEQFENDRLKAIKRIRGLGLAQRIGIVNTYKIDAELLDVPPQ